VKETLHWSFSAVRHWIGWIGLGWLWLSPGSLDGFMGADATRTLNPPQAGQFFSVFRGLLRTPSGDVVSFD
jgi:hypothetical protein